jgi:hypothetical protein
VIIDGVNLDYQNLLIKKMLKFYRNSIERLTLTAITFDSSQDFCGLMKLFINLRQISLLHVTIKTNNAKCQLLLPRLKSIEIELHSPVNSKAICEIFKHNESIEMVKISKSFILSSVDEFLKSLPNLNHLTMNDVGTVDFFTRPKLPISVEKLEALAFGFYTASFIPRTEVLESQMGKLKELTLTMLPFDNDGGKVLKFIIEKMNLRQFWCDENELIKNYARQNVKELQFNNDQIGAGVEMMKQFKSKSFMILKK